MLRIEPSNGQLPSLVVVSALSRPPGACQAPPSVGISQARILEQAAISFYRGSSQPRDQTGVSSIAGGFFINWATTEKIPLKSLGPGWGHASKGRILPKGAIHSTPFQESSGLFFSRAQQFCDDTKTTEGEDSQHPRTHRVWSGSLFPAIKRP